MSIDDSQIQSPTLESQSSKLESQSSTLESQSSAEDVSVVLTTSASMTPAPNSTMMTTMTNSTPIMSAKAETRDQTRAPVSGGQPQFVTKSFPINLPTQPTLGLHRPTMIEEIRPNPNESNSVSPVYPCPLCVGFFFTLAAMKSHLESEHRKYQCDICRKLMSHKRNVDRHRKSVHENQRGFGCPICVYKSAHKQVRIIY